MKETRDPIFRLRLDPILVEKFKRLPGGINEVGVKIVRDFGLWYEYDKITQSLDILGHDTEILALGVETLRFWIEDDVYPNTGVTCQIGYPNRHTVVWRFHGNYAKKFDHLFSEEIAQLKLIPTLNIKAVPSKKNPAFVELYCHFSFFQRVKQDVEQLSFELSRVYQDDFFVPKSDLQKARQFARTKAKDKHVLFALKELGTSDNIRVWIFAREQADVLRARREWLQHVGEIARDTNRVDPTQREQDIESASYIGGLTPSTLSVATLRSRKPSIKGSTKSANTWYMPPPMKIKGGQIYKPSNVHKISSFPQRDDWNFPRPHDFVYPINADIPKVIEEPEVDINADPFAFSANHRNFTEKETAKINMLPVNGTNTHIGEAKWVSDDESHFYRSRHPNRPLVPNKIYVHHQVNSTESSGGTENTEVVNLKRVVHPETNLIARERFSLQNRPGFPLKHSKSKQVTTQKGTKGQHGLKMDDISTVRKQPKMPLRKPELATMRYKITINGLDIVMYKHNIAKLNIMDAIINPVNTDVVSGGQIASSVYDAAGKLVLDEVRVHKNIFGDLSTADNVVTSAGKIPALGIIHVAVPHWAEYGPSSMEECARDLHTAIYKALKTAEAQKYRKVGLPILGAEPCFGVPKDLVAEVYVKALIDYSMAMGPLYPVLEIHLVDIDTQMLLKIKEAYEKWAANPGVKDMAQSVGTVADPMVLSELKQSAVTLEELPSHTSENMVTFLEQTYTDDGNQSWLFSVLGRLKVHVYSGNIIRTDSVEAIACGVDENIRGVLAKAILQEAGVAYEKSLTEARGSQGELEEGDIVVTNAGQLGMALVLHAVITQPIYKASFNNMERLENIYSNVLETASNLGLTSLAIPLLGTGRLREKFEIEQCGLQLIDVLIELVLSLGPDLSIRELHLVNENHVVTQSITQALRTRAHAQLRVEVEPRTNVRQEVLSSTNAVHRDQTITKDIHKESTILTAKEPTDTAKEPAIESASQVQKLSQHTTINEIKSNPIGVYVKHGKKKILKEKNGTDVTTKENIASKLRINYNILKKKISNEDTKELNNSEKEPDVRYLSETNLKTHEKLHTAWADSTKIAYKDPPRRLYQLEPLSREDIRPQLKVQKPNKPKQPLNTKFVMQRSRAESYKEKFNKRREKAFTDSRSGSDRKLRRTQSTGGLVQQSQATDVLEGFQRERMKLERLREMSSTEGNSHSSQQGISTGPANNRDTAFTHRPEVHSSPDRFMLQLQRGSQTSRVIDKTELSKKWVKGAGYDREVEDMYMKDVDTHLIQNAPKEDTYDNWHNGTTTYDYTKYGDIEHHAQRQDEKVVSEKVGNVETVSREYPVRVTNAPMSHTVVNETATVPAAADYQENVDKNMDALSLRKPENSKQGTENSSNIDENRRRADINAKSDVVTLRKGSSKTGKTYKIDIDAKRNKTQNKGMKTIESAQNLPKEAAAPTANDVTIRDKLKLEINVIDAKEIEDSPRIKKEKEKIKRFWEAVGANPNDESNFSELNSNDQEKFIVAKVTKERKMSARSKTSKNSGKSVIHNRGDFNVTVEVNS